MLNEQASTMMWPKSMQFIVASTAKKYWQKIMKIGEILKQMYLRRKPNKNCGTAAKPVTVFVTPRVWSANEYFQNCRN